MNKTLVFTILIIIVLIISNLSTKRYYYFLPTIPIYPNNKLEVQEVKKYINNRTQSDIDFIKLTKALVQHFFHMLKKI